MQLDHVGSVINYLRIGMWVCERWHRWVYIFEAYN